MKKIALILLICSYCLSSFGIGIKQSFCCGQLDYVSISFVQGSENIKEKSGCTNTIFQNFKLSDKHYAARVILAPVKFFFQLALFLTAPGTMFLTTATVKNADKSRVPLLFQSIPVYIFHCNFRI